mmetsp:Transcript_24884/g.46005  ORF Transcript_24884/g.46005 Transcript_24884/m.46005 type:complete len:388 (+) Transcript_24884:53-1216(+)
MHIIVFVLPFCLACASHGRRVHTLQASAKEEHQDSQRVLAQLLRGFSPRVGWQGAGAGRSYSDAMSHPSGRRAPAVRAFFGGKKVVVAGACSQTGQSVARSLTGSFRVTALCRPEIGERIQDDDGPITQTPVNFVAQGSTVSADAVVIATDEAPPAEAVSTLLKSCKEQGVGHAVLLSRLGASKGRIGLGSWKAAEEAATQAFGEEGLTIVRVGEPILGGPYYAREVDTIKWSSARAIDGYKKLEVQAGDELSQSGFGSPRGGAATAIAGVLRRGPEQQPASYSVTGAIAEPATTPADMDAMLDTAGGGKNSATAASGSLNLDLEDPILKPFTRFLPAKPPTIVDLLFGPPAVSGQYWGTIAIIAYGVYLTTTPDYIAKTGVDLWSR